MKVESQIACYSYFFEIENTLRVAMHNKLLSLFGKEYFNFENFPVFRSNLFGPEYDIDVVSQVMKNKNEEKDSKITPGYDFPFFWYLDTPQLLALLINHWDKYFYNIFNNPKTMRNEIILYAKPLRFIRNSIAHNRVITPSNQDKITIFLSMLKIDINKTLISNYSEIVFTPTNEYESIISEGINNILEDLRAGIIIRNEIIRSLESAYALIIQCRKTRVSINELESIIVEIRQCNKIKRIPGGIEAIRKYCAKTGLLDKLISIKDKGI